MRVWLSVMIGVSLASAMMAVVVDHRIHSAITMRGSTEEEGSPPLAPDRVWNADSTWSTSPGGWERAHAEPPVGFLFDPGDSVWISRQDAMVEMFFALLEVDHWKGVLATEGYQPTERGVE